MLHRPITDQNEIKPNDRLASRLFFLLTVIFILFVAFVSLTPGQSSYTPLHKWRSVWLNLFTAPGEIFAYYNLRDIATNVLLYLPLGLFLSLAVSWRRPRFATAWLLGGTAVSLLMEMIQAIIGRHSDPVDVLTNTTGFMLGFWVVVASIRMFGLRPSAFLGIGPGDGQDQKIQSLAALRFLYACLYLIVAIIPFDISVRTNRVYGQLFETGDRTRRILLDPFYHVINWQAAGGRWLLLELLGLLPMAVLTTLLARQRGINTVWVPVTVCLILAACGETAQLFIMSRTSDIAMLSLGAAAGLVGWWITRLGLKPSSASDAARKDQSSDRIRISLLALSGYAVIICLLSWAPYHFEINLGDILQKVRHQSNLVPFKLHVEAGGTAGAVSLAKQIGIFLPLGLLLTWVLSLRLSILKRSGMVIIAGLVGVGFGVLVELSQAVCVGKNVDITDTLLAGAGGLAGAALFNLFTRPNRS
jgi:VanZ family protein